MSTKGFANGWVDFLIESELPIVEKDAFEHQKKNGYHPAGYGFYDFTCVEVEVGKFLATWRCWSSCD